MGRNLKYPFCSMTPIEYFFAINYIEYGRIGI